MPVVLAAAYSSTISPATFLLTLLPASSRTFVSISTALLPAALIASLSARGVEYAAVMARLVLYEQPCTCAVAAMAALTAVDAVAVAARSAYALASSCIARAAGPHFRELLRKDARDRCLAQGSDNQSSTALIYC